MALAASIALLLGGLLLLGSRPVPSEAPTQPSLLDPSASRNLLPTPLPFELEKTPDSGPEKPVKSSLMLEQGGDGRTGIKITVEELPPGK